MAPAVDVAVDDVGSAGTHGVVAETAPVERAADGRSFDQLGWHVDLSQLADNRLIDAQRPQPRPALHVRVKLDAAEPAASAASAS